MMTVNEVSKLTGVSIRTLQYYDNIGLLHPKEYSESGYRLYDGKALERLQQILLFRELEFSLKDIKKILDHPNFDRDLALAQQIEMLTFKKEHLESLINFARELKESGVKTMSFNAFDNKKYDEYAKTAREKWEGTLAYDEYCERSKARSKEAETVLGKGLMEIFGEFGKVKELPEKSPEVQTLVKKLQSYITENYYQCTNVILSSLGEMYCNSEDFKNNIDSESGEGTADFVSKAIAYYCEQ